MEEGRKMKELAKIISNIKWKEIAILLLAYEISKKRSPHD